MDPAAVKDGECVFVKTDFFEFFVRDVVNRIPGKYIIVSHNGDLSAPDGYLLLLSLLHIVLYH